VHGVFQEDHKVAAARGTEEIAGKHLDSCMFLSGNLLCPLLPELPADLAQTAARDRFLRKIADMGGVTG
jgi:hypothetical protein